MAQPRNWYSNIKLIFLILFVLLFVGFAVRDIRADDASSPTIFLAFLVVIALVFKPWRQASDEGTPPKKPPSDGSMSGGQDIRKPPSSYLLAPLLMQDSVVVGETCDGWISCHPVATAVFAIVLILGVVGFMYGRKQARERELDERAGRAVKRP